MARPKNPNSRMKVVSARYSEAEHQAIKEYARSIGETPTTFIYQAVMNELRRNNARTEVYPNNPNQLSITDKVD